MNATRPPNKSVTEVLFSYFSTKTNVVGAQKNRLNGPTVKIDRLENIHNFMRRFGSFELPKQTL